MERFAPIPNCDILIIAGESSGDEHAARVVASLKASHPSLVIAALGGAKLHEAEAIMLDDLTAHASVGLWEVLKKLPTFLKLLDETIAWIAANKPKAVMFVDYPGFNLEIAKRLFEKRLSHKAGGATKLYFYISPQIWAWKKHRRFTMADRLDSLGVIFPFEQEFYKDTSLDVHFVGHPFVDGVFKNPLSYDVAGPIVLLPGSRAAIVKKHLPILWAAYQKYAESHPGCKVAAYYANEKLRQLMIKITAGKLLLYPAQAPLKASAVLSTAGTISLLTGLAGIPAAVMYRTDALTYAFGKSVYKLTYLGMPNLLLKRTAQKEFLQDAATPAALAEELTRLTSAPEALTTATQTATDLKALLGQAPSLGVNEWILGALK